MGFGECLPSLIAKPHLLAAQLSIDAETCISELRSQSLVRRVLNGHDEKRSVSVRFGAVVNEC